LPKKVILILDLLADFAVSGLAVVMIVVGWQYAVQIGSVGTYVSLPNVSRFWMYFPIPVAGVAMLVFEVESIYNHIRGIYIVKEEKAI
jgi:TRAP-type C4-dicarboxylate transport system permease small subunit